MSGASGERIGNENPAIGVSGERRIDEHDSRGVNGIPSDQENRPLVSIALATFNGERYLEELLDSIEQQSYPNLELVIADDGSSDRTLSLLKDRQWKRPCRILRPAGRLGVIGNFSRAIENAAGKYIALADQDDYWKADKLTLLVACIESLESNARGCRPALVFSDIAVVDGGLRELSGSLFEGGYSDKRCGRLADFLIINHVPGCAMLFNRALVEKSMPIPAGFKMHDWWLIMVAAAYGSIALVDRPLILYRQHGLNTVGAGAKKSSRLDKLAKVFRPSSWHAWIRHITPPVEAVGITETNLALFEARFGSTLPKAAARDLRLFRAGGRSFLPALRFVARARTGERVLYAIAMMRSVARRGVHLQPGSSR